MARQVYSQNLQRINLTASTHTVTVPSGFTWVFRDIALLLRTAVYATTFGIKLPGNLYTYFWEWSSSADPSPHRDELRLVFQDGDVVELEVAGGSVDIYICGYQLTLP